MDRTFQQTYPIPGTLSADLSFIFTAPFDMSLLHCSAVATNDSDALLVIGNSDDADEYLASTVIGDSNVPAEFDGDDWLDANGDSHTRYYPHIPKGTIVILALDHDGASGTAAQNVTIVLTCSEG